MVDRLEKMRRRATGNGVTHCLLCHTEFGLLASKSYAAMCVDCRKYVCQRNCGVETLDTQRGEVIFLCKICSEAREVVSCRVVSCFSCAISLFCPFNPLLHLF
ncbi:Rabphilin-3A effector domain protein [Cooperia oncophora]